MATRNDALLTLQVSVLLGTVGEAIAAIEPSIDEVLNIVDIQEIEQPENESVSIMKRLLLSSKEFVAAHKTVMQWADIHGSGVMKYEGSETVQ